MGSVRWWKRRNTSSLKRLRSGYFKNSNTANLLLLSTLISQSQHPQHETSCETRGTSERALHIRRRSVAIESSRRKRLRSATYTYAVPTAVRLMNGINRTYLLLPRTNITSILAVAARTISMSIERILGLEFRPLSGSDVSNGP
jgi:hypothetical protein